MEQNLNKPSRLTEPRPPHLETSLRARPPKYVKSILLTRYAKSFYKSFKSFNNNYAISGLKVHRNWS